MGPRAGWLLGAALVLATAGGARADEKADALIQASREAAARIETLQADLAIQLGRGRTVTGLVVAKRPNLFRLEMKGYPIELMVSDGKSLIAFMPRQNEYQKREVPSSPGGAVPPFVYPVRAFLSPASIAEGPKDATRTYKGRETVNGREYEVVEVVFPKPSETTVRWFFSPKDKLVYRVVNTPKDPSALPITAEITNVRTGAVLAADAFAWTPPATAKLYTPPTLADYEKKLVATGMPAPTFDLPAPGGGRVSLENTLKGKKAVLINFWFYG